MSNKTMKCTLTREDFRMVAELIGCETAALQAVQQVETGGRSGFFESGRPAILFEGHVFWRELQKRNIDPARLQKGNEDVLYPKWDKSKYKGGIAEYSQLEKACSINEEAAYASTSWGGFQIMGFNHKSCGEPTVASFVEAMRVSELNQLKLAARFIQSNKRMYDALRAKDWASFARYYNGSGYAANKYDEKLKAAYEKYKAME